MTIITDPDRQMDLPHLLPDVPPCEPWCKHQDSDDPSREHLTYPSIACMSEELFIPYAHGGRTVIEDRCDGDYPPAMPAYLSVTLFKDFGHDIEIGVDVSDGNGDTTAMTLRLSEAADLMEALSRLLRAAGYPVKGEATSAASRDSPARERQVHAQGFIEGFDHARLVHRTRRQRAAHRLADGLTLAGSAVRRLR